MQNIMKVKTKIILMYVILNYSIHYFHPYKCFSEYQTILNWYLVFMIYYLKQLNQNLLHNLNFKYYILTRAKFYDIYEMGNFSIFRFFYYIFGAITKRLTHLHLK